VRALADRRDDVGPRWPTSKKKARAVDDGRGLFLADRSVAFAGRGIDASVAVAVAALLLTVRVGRSRHARAYDRARGRADQRAFRVAADGLPEERAAGGACQRTGSRALLRRGGRAAGEHGC